MKILCLLLSLYVLFLATAACCPDDNCNDEIKTEQADHPSGDHKDEGCNSCSPFYNCGNCTGFHFPDVSFSLAPAAIILTTKISIYNPSFSSNYLSSIWQPPKIS